MPLPRAAAARVHGETPPLVDREVLEELYARIHSGRSQQLSEADAGEIHAIPDAAVLDASAEERVTGKGYRLCKRFMDIAIILLASPLLVAALMAVAVAVRLTVKGPVFYRHQRVGRYGRPFTMLKFCTMRVDADRVLEEHLSANPSACAEWRLTQKLRWDPRLTASGRFLRRTSLDELPQIWNVLRGEMSLVGPRPIVASEKAKYGDRIHFYMAVLPGVTGLWQVSGRSDVSYATRIALDEIYVRKWSLTRDLKILIKTPRTVCRCEGAY